MSSLPSNHLNCPQEMEKDCKQVPSKVTLFEDDFSWVNDEGEMLTAADIDNINLDAFQQQDAILAKLGYRSCLEKNEPTPRDLVIHRTKVLLDLASNLSNQQDKKCALFSVAKYLVQPFDQVMKDCNSTDSDDAKSVRQIESQVLVRLLFWARLGNNFLLLYKKQKLCRKQKKSSKRKGSKLSQARNILLNDIIDLLSKAAMRLPQSRPFQGLLRGCLDHSFLSDSMLTMDVFDNLFDYFEIANPYLSAKPDDALQFPSKPPGTKKKKVSAVIPPSAIPVEAKKDNKNTTNPTSNALAEKELGRTKEENDGQPNKPKKAMNGELDFLKPVSFVAQASKKKNSLLSGSTGGQRGQFVGSHFNSSLSNMTALFRQVKAVQKPNKTVSQNISKNKSTSSSSIANSSTITANSHRSKRRKVTIADPNTTAVGHKRKLSQCFQANTTAKQKKQNRRIVQETPLPNKRSVSRIAHGGMNAGADMKSARQVVAAARNALRRQN